MGKPQYIVTNIIVGKVITVSSEDANFPKANLADGIVAKPFKFAAKVAQTITIDLGLAQAVDIAVLLNHNFTSSATVTLRRSNDNFVNNDVLVGVFAIRERDMYMSFTQASDRYWRLTVDDGSNSANPAIGEFLLGVKNEIEMFNIGWELDRIQMNIIHETERGVRHAFDLFERRILNLPFGPLSESQINQIVITLHQATNGSLIPFVFIPDIDKPDLFYVRLTNNPRRTSIARGSFQTALVLEEEVRGIRLS